MSSVWTVIVPLSLSCSLAAAARDGYLLWRKSQTTICAKQLSASLQKARPGVAAVNFERLAEQLCRQDKFFWPSVEVNDPAAFDRRLSLNIPDGGSDSFVAIGLWGSAAREKKEIVEALREVLFPFSKANFLWRDDFRSFDAWVAGPARFGGLIVADLDHNGETPNEKDINDHNLIGFIRDQELNWRYAHVFVLTSETPLQNWRRSALLFRHKMPWVEVEGQCAVNLRKRE